MGYKEWTPGAVLLMVIVVGVKIAVRLIPDEEEPDRVAQVTEQHFNGIQSRMDRRMQNTQQWNEQREAQMQQALNNAPRASDYMPPRVDVTPPPGTTYTPPAPPPGVTITPGGAGVPTRPGVEPGRVPGGQPGERPGATPRVPGQAERPGVPGAGPDIEPAAEPEPESSALVLEHSPMPDASELLGYERWSASAAHEDFVGSRETVGAFRLRVTSEFVFEGKGSRAAEWDAPSGTRGVGLDLRIDPLMPRDAGLTSPVVEDVGDRQVFRLGRRAERGRGEAGVSYQEVNGLLVWRITLPASERSQLATCHYVTIANGEMCVLTARYDKDKPEQLDGFDAMVQTLEYVR